VFRSNPDTIRGLGFYSQKEFSMGEKMEEIAFWVFYNNFYHY
jgi:hypothetical protein